jgi:hypothetical protein
MTPSFAQEGSTVILKDDAQRSLPCQVEQAFELRGNPYALLLPVDNPVEIFAWVDTEDEDEEMMVDVEDEDIDALFATAKAVLAEQNLTLQRTAITLTAAGELPEANDEDCITLDVSDDLTVNTDEDASEAFQILATFFQDDVEYTICTPLDPLLIFAQFTAAGEAIVVPPENFEQLQPELEAKLFDLLE